MSEFNQSETTLQVVALIAVLGFIVWLVFFSGNGDLRSFVADLSSGKRKKKKATPASLAARKETNRFLADYSYDIKNWVSRLRQTREDISSESSVLLAKYPPIEKKTVTKKGTDKNPPSKRTAAKKTSKKASGSAGSKKSAKPAAKKKVTKKAAPVTKRGSAKTVGTRKVASKKRPR